MRDEAGPGVGRCGCAPSDASAVEGAAIEWQERGTRRPPPSPRTNWTRLVPPSRTRAGHETHPMKEMNQPWRDFLTIVASSNVSSP